MTEKEIAEKSFLSHELAYKVNTDRRSYEDGFIAGFKAGGLQWHDLRENPNDLPNEFDTIRKAFGSFPAVVSPHIVLNQDGERVYCRRNPENKQQAWYWAYASDDLGFAPNPIAWCEIPKYEEKK